MFGIIVFVIHFYCGEVKEKIMSEIFSSRERSKLRENLITSLLAIRKEDSANGIISDAIDLEMWVLHGIVKKSPTEKVD